MKKQSIFAAFAIAFTLFSFLGTAHAVTLWYNGDVEGDAGTDFIADGIVNGINFVYPEARVYDDFVVPAGGWTVAGVFGINLMDVLGVSQAAWEIRSGVSEGNGGTLIAGDTSPATQTFTGGGFAGFEEFEIKVSGLNIELSPGTYWLSVAPVGFGPVDFNSVDNFFLRETQGTNFIGFQGNNGNAFVTIPALGGFFAESSTFQVQPLEPLRPFDFALGIEGLEGITETTIPEPSTLFLIGSGLAGFALRRKRKIS